MEAVCLTQSVSFLVTISSSSCIVVTTVLFIFHSFSCNCICNCNHNCNYNYSCDTVTLNLCESLRLCLRDKQQIEAAQNIETIDALLFIVSSCSASSRAGSDCSNSNAQNASQGLMLKTALAACKSLVNLLFNEAALVKLFAQAGGYSTVAKDVLTKAVSAAAAETVAAHLISENEVGNSAEAVNSDNHLDLLGSAIKIIYMSISQR